MVPEATRSLGVFPNRRDPDEPDHSISHLELQQPAAGYSRQRITVMAKRSQTTITISDMHALAAQRGGKCLSEEYINTDSPLLWQCAAGHQWRARPAKIKKGQWCRVCAGYAKRTIEEMQAYARSRGGKCLSKEYKGLGSPLEWECAVGHRWPARPGNVLHLNTWCPYCAGRIVTREELADLAAARGGKLLSSVYLGAQRLHLWRCCDGHDFEATPNRVKNGGWCPQCQIYYGEEIARLFMEAVFAAPFPRSFPAFLREVTSRSWLQLDGYNEQLAIAFEHHGLQHYQRVPQFHRTAEEFSAQQERDAQKAEMCKSHGVRLFIIPAIPDLTSLADLPGVIAQQATQLGLATPRDAGTVSPDLNRVFCVSQYTSFQRLIWGAPSSCFGGASRGTSGKQNLTQSNQGHGVANVPASRPPTLPNCRSLPQTWAFGLHTTTGPLARGKLGCWILCVNTSTSLRSHPSS